MKVVYYLTFYSYCGKNLDFLLGLLKKLFIECKIIQLPKKKSKFVVIKSPHVFNKAREHFETIYLKKLIYLVLDYKKKDLLNSILKGIYWSVFGVSLKKKKISKNCFYYRKLNK